MLVRIQPLPPKFGGSRGRRWVLARLMTTRVRYPGPPPIISLKCYLVASAVWGRVVLVRIQVGRPVFALVSLVVEVLFCNQGVWVRFLQGAPSNLYSGRLVARTPAFQVGEAGSKPVRSTKHGDVGKLVTPVDCKSAARKALLVRLQLSPPSLGLFV